MKTFTQSAFAQAKQFIFRHGRKLDQHRFEFHFENGPATAVLAELASYQNGDGGFGHALEPDVRTPASSAIATAQAFHILKEINAPATKSMVQAAVDFLLHSYNPERNVWLIVPPQVDDAPHAPWWNYNTIEQNFDGFLANPRAELLGALYHYHQQVPPDFLTKVAHLVIAHLHTLPDKMSMHDLLCYQTLAESNHVPDAIKHQIVAKLTKAIPATVSLNPAEWDNYTLKPLDVISAPTALFANTLPPESIKSNLAYVVETQAADGGWPLPWSWAHLDAEAWALAEQEWRGYLAVQKLKILQAFGQVDD